MWRVRFREHSRIRISTVQTANGNRKECSCSPGVWWHPLSSPEHPSCHQAFSPMAPSQDTPGSQSGPGSVGPFSVSVESPWQRPWSKQDSCRSFAGSAGRWPGVREWQLPVVATTGTSRIWECWKKWYYPTPAHEFQGFRVWRKFVLRTLELMATPNKLANQVKVSRPLDQSHSVQSREPEWAHQNN